MVTDAYKQLNALGDPTRRAILQRLAKGPLPVHEIARGLSVGRPAVSMHLRILKDAGLVQDTPEGNKRLYRLHPAGLEALRNYVDWYWMRALESYVSATEEEIEMSDPSTHDDIRVVKAVTVDLPIHRAFSLFTDMGRWWPIQTHHLAESPGVIAVLEPGVGGRWFERMADGSECEWGRVKVWDPPHHILLTWQVSAGWRYVADPNKVSEVEVQFIEENPGRTRVEFAHQHLERYGNQTERMRTVLERPTGAGDVLRAYATAAHDVSHSRLYPDGE